MRSSYYAKYIYVSMILFVVWSGRVTNAEINEGHRISCTQPQVARMDQRRGPHAASMWGVRAGRGRTGKPKTPWQTRYREKQEGTGHKQQKPGANGEDKHNDLTTNVTYCADISRKWLNWCIYWSKCHPTRPKWNFIICSKVSMWHHYELLTQR
jgi:hypothetical protein